MWVGNNHEATCFLVPCSQLRTFDLQMHSTCGNKEAGYALQVHMAS